MTARPFNARYSEDGVGPYRVDVDTGEGQWATNALTFDTVEDGEAYARDLAARWTLVRRTRVVSTSTPDREAVIS